MHAVFSHSVHLDSLLRKAAQTAGLEAEGFQPEVRVADPKHGDYQANGVLGYAKARKLNPRTVAEALKAALPQEEARAYTFSIAGPGFINIALTPDALSAWINAFPDRPSLEQGASSLLANRTWVIDYSSPNTAKQMHVGHLRSAVIGEALSRLATFAGARVIRDNHIGDWGTQFGKLIWAYKRHLDTEALARDPIEEFERLYKVGNSTSEADPAVLEEARGELVKLQAGDAENLAIWRRINEVSLEAFQRIYDLLGIRFDHTLGESFYNDKVERVYRELSDLGIAAESDGALVVFHPEHPRFKEQPFIIRKRDGAANYGSTDLATILHRTETFGADACIYVIDSRQGDHCQQLFLTAEKWYAQTHRRLPRLEHVSFGTVTGEDGKPLKTRNGDNIRLKDLLDEARERAARLVDAKAPDLPAEERRNIAEVVGIGSVQYADLSQNRSSDYVFAWDKMISLEGNTAAYLLYAGARIHSIFRKLETDPAAAPKGSAPATPAEVALARKLVKFPDALALATHTLRPHFLCLYLYELAGEFSAFYTADKVAVEEIEVRERRLALCARTLLVLETGLRLLGLRTLERM
jgi:arginyl-tRNA synthetase